MKLNNKELFLIAVIVKENDNNWTSPTKLGVRYGKFYHNASSWASPTLLNMVKKGILYRSSKGHYCVIPKKLPLYRGQINNIQLLQEKSERLSIPKKQKQDRLKVLYDKAINNFLTQYIQYMKFDPNDWLDDVNEKEYKLLQKELR